MLSRYERKRLREIENWFETNDPTFVDYVRTGEQFVLAWQCTLLVSASAVGVLIFVLGLLLAVPSAVLLGLFLGLGGFWLRSCRRKAAEGGQRRDLT